MDLSERTQSHHFDIFDRFMLLFRKRHPMSHRYDTAVVISRSAWVASVREAAKAR